MQPPTFLFEYNMVSLTGKNVSIPLILLPCAYTPTTCKTPCPFKEHSNILGTLVYILGILVYPQVAYGLFLLAVRHKWLGDYINESNMLEKDGEKICPPVRIEWLPLSI